MGSGVSSEFASKLSAASSDEVRVVLTELRDVDREKLTLALKAAEGGTEKIVGIWAVPVAHKAGSGEAFPIESGDDAKVDANRQFFRVTVCTLTGDSFDVACSDNMLAKEFWHLLAAQKVPLGSPKTLKILIGGEVMKAEVSLKDQGLQDSDAVTLVYEEITKAMQDAAAKNVLHGNELVLEDLHAWHSINVLPEVETLTIPCPLPQNLQGLTFHCNFNERVEHVALPAGLQSLTFGDHFNQSMENVSLPTGLQSLTFGCSFNKSMENVSFPMACRT